MMAKYKAKKYINHHNSYNGLDVEDWEKLNNGETVELNEVPKEAKRYLEKVSTSKKESK